MGESETETIRAPDTLSAATESNSRTNAKRQPAQPTRSSARRIPARDNRKQSGFRAARNSAKRQSNTEFGRQLRNRRWGRRSFRQRSSMADPGEHGRRNGD